MGELEILKKYGDILRPCDLQEILPIGRDNVYRCLKNGQIPSIRIGTKYLIPKPYFITFLLGGGQING